MAKQVIGIGAAGDDGTGDPLRTAFGKVNDNFTELYNAPLPTVAPSTPAAGNANLFQNGVTTNLGIFSTLDALGKKRRVSDLMNCNVAALVAGNNFGITALGCLGVFGFNGANPSNTNLFTSMARGEGASAATAGSSIEYNTCNNNGHVSRGDAAGRGGFIVVARFGIADAAAVANARMFIGLAAGWTTNGNNEPSSKTDVCGIGCDAGETTLSIIHNDNSGTATKVSLGANFPSNTQSTDVYELVLYCAPNGTAIEYAVTRINTGHVATGTLTTNLISNGAFFGLRFARNNGATALAVRLAIFGAYMEALQGIAP